MGRTEAIAISTWHYEGQYKLYSMDGSEEVQKELMEQQYFCIFDEEELIGYFCIGEAAQVPVGKTLGMYEEDLLDIGVGMKPNKTGKGIGYPFLSFILSYIQKQYKVYSFRLTVASFNERAITLYRKHGFQKTATFHRDDMEFFIMTKEDI
ncbi:GNAT family N-acetyltransferase [Microbacteriaceae bacterium 4G12]